MKVKINLMTPYISKLIENKKKGKTPLFAHKLNLPQSYPLISTTPTPNSELILLSNIKPHVDCKIFEPREDKPKICRNCDHSFAFHKIIYVDKLLLTPKNILMDIVKNGAFTPNMEELEALDNQLTHEQKNKIDDKSKSLKCIGIGKPTPIQLDCPEYLRSTLEKLEFMDRWILERQVRNGFCSWDELNRKYIVGGELENLKKILLKSFAKAKAHQFVLYRIRVSPEGIIMHPPTLHHLNRVARQFGGERLLSVHFSDDVPDFQQIRHLYKHVLTNGIYIAGRKYEALNCSSSGAREHSYWFFATEGVDLKKKISIKEIHEWMGDFSKCESIPKKCSRLFDFLKIKCA